MSHLIDNSFSSYQLSEDEAVQGSIFTLAQRQVLQNHLAVTAEEKLALEFDPKEPENFMQQEAAKKGVIEFIRYLLDTSDVVQDELNNPTDQSI